MINLILNSGDPKTGQMKSESHPNLNILKIGFRMVHFLNGWDSSQHHLKDDHSKPDFLVSLDHLIFKEKIFLFQRV